MTPLEILATGLMLWLVVMLFIWTLRMKRFGSQSRRTRMMSRLGLDPGIQDTDEAQLQTVMKEVRQRCGRCPSEALCERWLVGEVGGDNLFCPNADIFRSIRERDRIAIV